MYITDWRDLPRHGRTAGKRRGVPRYVTLHYNGPAIPQPLEVEHWRKHLEFVANYHAGPYLKADGIQYHYAVLPAGDVVRLRDDDAQLWHAGNATANAESLAVHFPLGGAQQPTWRQWQAFESLANHLEGLYGIGRDSYFGHRQWPRRRGMARVDIVQAQATDCPGDPIMAALASWRLWRERGLWRTKYRANVREAPRVTAPIAWNGACILMPGTVLEGATMVEGEPFRGDARWLHWPGGGFVHMSAAEYVSTKAD